MVVEKSTIDGLVTGAKMRPAWQPAPSIPAEAERIVANSDVVEAATKPALIDVPNMTGGTADERRLAVHLAGRDAHVRAHQRILRGLQ